MSDYTQIFDDTVSPTLLIGQTTLTAIRTGVLGNGAGPFVPAISGNWYPSGAYFNTVGITTNNNLATANNLFFAPFFVSKTTTYTKIGVVSNSPAAGTVVLGMYNDSGNGKPTGSPIANSNSGTLALAANTLASYTFPTPITLNVGVYWTAIATPNATDRFFSKISNNGGIGGRGLGLTATPTNSNSAAPTSGWNQSFTYGATLPTVGALTGVFQGSVIAELWLQAQ